MRSVVAIALGAAVVATACGSSNSGATTTTRSIITTPPSTVTAGSVVLAEGTLELPAADAFGDPGFHEVLVVTATAPPGGTAGQTLVVRLRDARRPDQACDSEHPLSGCVTVDWSDIENRPNVPEGGVFDNHLTVDLVSGPRTFFLSETGALADEPDAFSPG
jgi:hypothetical protein